MRDCSFLKPYPCADPLAGHQADARSALELCTSAGMKAGSFWPSPSSVTTIGPRARACAATHRGRLPAGGTCLHCRSRDGFAISERSSARVPSVDPSLT